MYRVSLTISWRFLCCRQDSETGGMVWPLRCFFACVGPKTMPVFCFPEVKESTSTRFMYCCMLSVVAIFSAIFQSGTLSDHVRCPSYFFNSCNLAKNSVCLPLSYHTM